MKIKKLLSLTAAAVMALTALAGAISVSADTVDSGTCGDLTWMLDSNGVLTFSGKGDMASPTNLSANTQPSDFSSVYTYKIYTESIKEVIIEEGAISIGYCAFYKMPNIETVVLPSTITEFKGIKNLVNNVENSAAASATADQYAIYNYAFAECTSLENLTLTEGMTNIGAYAFYSCTSLESVTIPKSIDNWDIYTFSDCTSLKNVTLTDGLTTIGSFAFNNTAIQSIVIPSTVEKWRLSRSDFPSADRNNANCAFVNCKRLSSVTFSDGIEKIGYAVFANCSSLKKVAIPASITIMNYSFEYCTGLQEAYIEDGAQIQPPNTSSENFDFQNAFYKCENLKRVEIPAGIDVAYKNPQWCTECSSLTDIYLHGKDDDGYIPVSNETSIYHCYFDTTTYNMLVKKNNIPDERMVSIEEDISTYLDIVKTRLNEAKAYDESKYTPESYGVLKALIEKAETFDENSSILAMDWTASDIRTAIRGLEKKSDEPSSDSTEPTSDEPSSDNPSEPSSDPSSEDPSNPSDNTTQPTSNVAPTTAAPATTAPTTAAPKANANNKAVQAAKDKANAEKVMKQAKITKLTAKAKGKKKIVVSWKKVSKAKGYTVQVSNKKNFKKVLVDKTTSKVKLTIKSNKIKSKKTYYVRVRAYTTYKDANGKTQKVYSSWIKKTRKVKAK